MHTSTHDYPTNDNYHYDYSGRVPQAPLAPARGAGPAGAYHDMGAYHNIGLY